MNKKLINSPRQVSRGITTMKGRSWKRQVTRRSALNDPDRQPHTWKAAIFIRRNGEVFMAFANYSPLAVPLPMTGTMLLTAHTKRRLILHH